MRRSTIERTGRREEGKVKVSSRERKRKKEREGGGGGERGAETCWGRVYLLDCTWWAILVCTGYRTAVASCVRVRGRKMNYKTYIFIRAIAIFAAKVSLPGMITNVKLKFCLMPSSVREREREREKVNWT